MSEVVFDSITKNFAGQIAVNNFSMTVRSGEFVTLLGPSGCGKTTCLRIVAGFISPSSGKVMLNGRDITWLAPHRRNMGVVFQSYALFPNHTVFENVAFGLKVRRQPREEVARRTTKVLRMVRLDTLADRFPSQLSGGQKQRVALARAVVIQPDVLLLDEPLAALDLKMREELQVEIRKIQQELKITALFVTHDQGEALRMSDRVAVMRDGGILQMDAPEHLYRRPNSRYVASFVGHTNLFTARVVARNGTHCYRLRLEAGGDREIQIDGPQGQAFEAGESCLIGIRPEDITIGGEAESLLRAHVIGIQYSGSQVRIDLEAPATDSFHAVVPGSAIFPSIGDNVPVGWRPNTAFLLPVESE